MTAGYPYHKIHSAFKRDASSRRNVVIPYDWSRPEFEYLSTVRWDWTEKIDGTNMRLHWDGEKVTVGGRTEQAQIRADLYDALRAQGWLEQDLWAKKWPWVSGEAPPDVTLYGEGYGPRIQKGGGLYRDDPSFILFDVKIGQFWLRRDSIEEIAMGFDMDFVPFVGTCTPMQAWKLLLEGELSSYWVDRGVQMEGIVGTPAVPLVGRDGNRVIMKMKYKDVNDWRLERGISDLRSA